MVYLDDPDMISVIAVAHAEDTLRHYNNLAQGWLVKVIIANINIQNMAQSPLSTCYSGYSNQIIAKRGS